MAVRRIGREKKQTKEEKDGVGWYVVVEVLVDAEIERVRSSEAGC